MKKRRPLTALVTGGREPVGRFGFINPPVVRGSTVLHESVAQMKELLKEVHRACEEDIHFLCDGIQPGGGRIAACLKQSATEVSPGCKAAIGAAKAAK